MDEPGYVADPNAALMVKPGCQRLDGDQALAYVRARHLPCDHIPDFARIGRQQQFLRSVINQMLRPSMVARAPSLVRPVLSALHRDQGLRPSDLIYLVGQLRGLSSGAVEFRTVPGTAATIDGKAVLRVDPAAEEIFDSIRRGRPLGTSGAQLVNTPPSEANTKVVVVDDASGGRATDVLRLLSSAGFDVSAGIRPRSAVPLGQRGPAIVHRSQASAQAQVVAAYFPDLPVIASDSLRGAQVAIVVPSSFRMPASGQGGGGGTDAGCPAV